MIEINNVSFSYQNQEKGGLRNINLKINKGECILLCGRSGCGKSTITHLINGLIPNFYAGDLSGKITVNGLETAGTPMYKIAAHVGSVFQNPRTQFFNVDTDSEIAFGIENAALPPEQLYQRVDETTLALNIEHIRGRNIFELSGGEKQKIAFASIYAMNPDIFLLDEPSSNLDMDAIHDLEKQLHYIKQQGKTILIAEHRLHYLVNLADRIIYLSDGEIVDIYTPQQFVAIEDRQRKKMGLRAIELNRITPKNIIHDCSTAPVLKIKNLCLHHKKKLILENVTLSASMGDIIAITGHNGAGKTTFSRTLCGLHKETFGEVLWNDSPQPPKSRKRNTYMVMQDVNYQLFAESVEAECYLGILNPDKELIDKTLELLNLLPFRSHHPNTLSGGQKQRVTIAVSMICHKEILVFDEPTSGLDYDSMRQVSKLTKKLSAMNKIIFIVTHDYEFICETCNRLLHFDDNKLMRDIHIAPQTVMDIKSIFDIKETS